MFNKSRNLWFDLLRGLSALVVCLGHLRNAILVDGSELIHPSLALKAFYFLTGFGHQAVMVFFVLSGYFVGGAVLRSGVNFSWKSYLVSRLTRLWVVLIPCLLLTWGIGLIVEHYALEAALGANNQIWHSGPKIGEYSVSLDTLLANIFFLQTIASPVFGFNGPLWSLANEFWYYMLFPMIAIGLGLLGKKAPIVHGAILLLALIIASWLPHEILNGFLIWLLGVAVYSLQRKIRLINPVLARIFFGFSVALFTLVVFNVKFSFVQISGIQSDFMVGLSFACLCLSLTNQKSLQCSRPILAKFALYISEVSYSLYLSHFPVVILIATTMYQSKQVMPDGWAVVQFACWGIFLLALASLWWWFFESRTAFVRSKVLALTNLGFKQ
jgi:peptidoglycan/LPS O-acetylase OafA/YrhL